MQKKKPSTSVLKLGCTIVAALLLLITNIATAKNTVDSCKQIIVVGDVNWPPYAMQEVQYAESADPASEYRQIDGIAIELVAKIFAELDLPIQVIRLDSRRNIYNGLQLGDIDVLVSTYKNNEIEEVADLIIPGYLQDPIAVYVRKGMGVGINRWDDLIGKRGVMTDNFAFNEKFASYVSRYLYVHAKGSLSKVLGMVNEQQADYVIGSRLQLEHGVKHANLSDDMELLPNVIEPDEVQMGFAKNSLCRAYLPYLRRRLLELKEDGTVNDIVTRYLAKDSVKSQTEDDEQAQATSALPTAATGSTSSSALSEAELLEKQVLFEVQPEKKDQVKSSAQPTDAAAANARANPKDTAAANARAKPKDTAADKASAQPTNAAATNATTTPTTETVK